MTKTFGKLLIVFLLIVFFFPGSSAPFALAAGIPPAGLADYERWVGSQHAHINMDGDDGAAGSTAAQAFAYAQQLPHLQYFIISPHVHQSRSGSATLYSDATYTTIRASAISATTASFIAVAGQEVSTISTGGHWSLFNAALLVGTDHADGDWNDTDDYYDHIAGLGASGAEIAFQFDHPNAGDFGNRYAAEAAPYGGTLAVSSGPAYSTAADFSATGSYNETEWAQYLNLGWKLSPAADQDNHYATWGATSSAYTVMVRQKGTAFNLSQVMQGLREHMTYATEDANAQIGFIANGWSMGQTIGGDANVAFTIWWNNPSEAICNNNGPVCRTEPANDGIQNIWIYKNSFSSPITQTQPNTASGAWSVSVAAAVGDWFVVKFRDSSTLATSGRTSDQIWSAPVWYNPAAADVPLTAEPIPTYTLTLAAAGTGMGVLTPTVGTYTYPAGTVVLLTATANTGSTFAGWSGDLAGTTNPTSVTLDASKRVTATFNLLPTPAYTLTLALMGTGTGVVLREPDRSSYAAGTVVTLTALPAAGSLFAGWSGDLSGTTNPVTLTLDADRHIIAQFDLAERLYLPFIRR